jgi:hypothetical protein
VSFRQRLWQQRITVFPETDFAGKPVNTRQHQFPMLAPLAPFAQQLAELMQAVGNLPVEKRAARANRSLSGVAWVI